MMNLAKKAAAVLSWWLVRASLRLDIWWMSDDEEVGPKRTDFRRSEEPYRSDISPFEECYINERVPFEPQSELPEYLVRPGDDGTISFYMPTEFQMAGTCPPGRNAKDWATNSLVDHYGEKIARHLMDSGAVRFNEVHGGHTWAVSFAIYTKVASSFKVGGAGDE